MRECNSNEEVRFAPFFLFPSLFPERGFRRALLVQNVMNKLMMAVAHDRQFMTKCLKKYVSSTEMLLMVLLAYACHPVTQILQKKNPDATVVSIFVTDFEMNLLLPESDG